MLTDEEIQRIAIKVANYILPDILTKLDSGFNVTEAEHLNRLAKGDHDVRTAPIDPA